MPRPTPRWPRTNWWAPPTPLPPSRALGHSSLAGIHVSIYVRVYPAFGPRRFSLNPCCCSRWRLPDRRSVRTHFCGCSCTTVSADRIPTAVTVLPSRLLMDSIVQCEPRLNYVKATARTGAHGFELQNWRLVKHFPE